MRRELRKCLYDVGEACRLIGEFTAGKTFADYEGNVFLRSAVERQFQIVGEALNQAVRLDPALAERISDVPRIIGFRNRLIHGYSDISNAVVWGVLERYLPVLRREIAALMDAGESGEHT